MSGLLDSKSRIIDAILTQNGKSQALSGGLKIKYVSFSDSGSKYVGDANDIALHSDIKIALESFSTPWDDITIETDEVGLLYSYFGDRVSLTRDGKVLSSGSLDSSFVNPVDAIVSSSLSSFENQMILSTRDPFRNDPGLTIVPNSYSFSITSETPFSDEPPVSSIDDIDSFFSDKRLSNVPNFKFLPPLQKIPNTNDLAPLGNYENLSENNDLNRSDLLNLLGSLELASFEFSNQTEEHTLVIQIFEESIGEVKKLDVIRYGPIGISPEGGRSILYFVGKVFTDGFEVPTFVNLFTMVLE